MSEGSREEYCVGVCDVDVDADGLSWGWVGLNSNLSNRMIYRMTTTRNYYRKENERGDMHGRREVHDGALLFYFLLRTTINFVRVKYTHNSSAPCVRLNLHSRTYCH
jgi:hypothetical protein